MCAAFYPPLPPHTLVLQAGTRGNVSLLGRWGLASRIGFTYIGTVVGAGFASGQEILQFFTLFGKYSYWGILLGTFLFSWLGTRMMLMGHKLQAQSYEDVNDYLFGPYWGKWMSVFIGISLFGVTTAMMSGVGALFEEQVGISFHVGVIATAVLSFFVMIRGMDGILSVNSWVVPLMFLFTICATIRTLQQTNLATLWQASPWVAGNGWFLSAIAYVAFNLAMSQAVLVPLGAEIGDEQAIRRGGWMGGIGLGMMLLAINAAMQLQLEEIVPLKIPMAFVISTLGVGMKIFFLLVMWAEIFTTLVGNVYGLAMNLKQVVPFRLYTIMALLFLGGYFFSLIGFPTLVHYLYPLFGYCGLILLALLVIRPLPRM
jgi:uncharacterized membrane protein YkvI